MTQAQRLIALASGVHPDLDPDAMVRVAGEAGYNSVGIWVEPGVNWHRTTTAQVRNELEQHELTALDVEVIWLQPDSKPDPVHHQIKPPTTFGVYVAKPQKTWSDSKRCFVFAHLGVHH